MKKVTILFFLSLLTLAFHSCIREETYDNNPKGNFEALWRIIDERYCFLDYKSEAYGLDWSNVYSKYRSRIHDGMTRLQLFEVMADMLSELRDGHVNLYTSADVGRYWSWHEDYPTNFNDSVQRLYLGKNYKIASGLKYTILDDNIGYIYYESFSSAIGEGNLDDVLLALQVCNGLILDVRNNSGGQLTYSERLAQRFTNEKILVGYTSHKTGKGHSDFSNPLPEYISPSKRVRWQKKVVVLTNRKCYSATNTFVRNMKACSQATIMGDQTGGGSGLPFSSELPNGWSVRFSACPMFDAQMQQIEFGIQPDVVVAMKSEDIQRGKDTLIEKARSFLKE